MTEQQALQHTTPEIRKHWETYGYMPGGYDKYEVGQMVWWDGITLLITRFTDETSPCQLYNGMVYYIWNGEEHSHPYGVFQQYSIPLFLDG